MDNPLKRSFDLNFKEQEDNSEEKVDHENAFDQSDGATSFLKEQSNPFSSDETTEKDDGMDEALASALGEGDVPDEFEDEQEEDEEEMEEADRGAVEDVLAHINDDYSKQEEDQDRGAVEDVLRSLNGSGDGYSLGEGEVPDELEDNQFEKEDEEDEMDEIVASVLDELNDGGEQGLREDWKSRIVEDEEDPCWDDYTMVGTKMQDGEEVPNCVPDDDVPDAEGFEESIDPNSLADAVLQDQVEELHRLDQLAEQVLNSTDL
jgi:hypothetical protein